MNHVPRFEPSTKHMKHRTSNVFFTQTQHGQTSQLKAVFFRADLFRLQDDEEVVRAPQHTGGRRMIFDRDNRQKYGGGLTRRIHGAAIICYINGVPWIPSIYPLYVRINIPAPLGSVMGNCQTWICIHVNYYHLVN